MTFPRLLIFTDRAQMQPSFELALLAACQGGARWFCLREKDLDPRAQLDHFRRAARVTGAFGAQLFLSGRADIARAAHADGLQLPENELSVADARLCLGFHTPMGRSVHDAEGARRAADEGASYLILGAIWPTASHPGQTGIGLENLRAVCARVSVPVYAIGGVTADNAAQCLEAGAAGAAVLSGVWGTSDVTARVRQLRAALGESDPVSHHAVSQEGAMSNAAPKPGNGSSSPLSDIISKSRNAARPDTGAL